MHQPKLATRFCAVALLTLPGSCTPEPEQALTVVVGQLPLRTGTAVTDTVAATVGLGSPLKGRMPGMFGSKEHWEIRLNDGTEVFAPLTCCAVLGEPTTMVATAAVPAVPVGLAGLARLGADGRRSRGPGRTRAQ